MTNEQITSEITRLNEVRSKLDELQRLKSTLSGGTAGIRFSAKRWDTNSEWLTDTEVKEFCLVGLKSKIEQIEDELAALGVGKGAGGETTDAT